MSNERRDAKALASQLFKNDDSSPFELSDGQADIFNTIVLKKHFRNQIMTPTQYGKSETVAMAVIVRAITYRESWTIVSGDYQKTDIIMKKVINHLFDNEFLEAQIDPAGVTHIERLKHERSRTRITFLKGGEIRVVGADARNKKRVKESLTGQGARNMIEDEAALIPDDLQAMVMRMLGGFADSFLLKIGNPFYRNHFFRSWQNHRYNNIRIDYHQALREGRLTEDFIEEMRTQPFFRELYEVEFPDRDEILIDGYRALISEKLLESAFVEPDTIEPEGTPILGCDFAGGGNDRSAYVIRYDNIIKLLQTNKIGDTMQQIPIIEDYAQTYNVDPANIFLDTGGLGQGIGDRLHEKDFYTNNIMFGEKALDSDLYKNRRAEMYYRFKEWLEAGGKIEYDEAWYELLSVNYKTDSERKFQIQPKIDLKKRMKELSLSVTSPDVADAAVLTFGEGATITEEDFEFI